MIYTSQSGDSLLSIAGKLTYGGFDYAFAIAEMNGLASEDQTWSNDAKFALVSAPLATGTSLEIADDWMRVTPTYLQTGNASPFSDGFFKWAGLALALVAIMRT